MKEEKEVNEMSIMVCSECGSDKITEIRFVELYVNDCFNHGYFINNELIGYHCPKCCSCPAKIIQTEIYLKKIR